MGKRIYITEDIANELSEMVKPLSELPNDIKNALRGHKTSLGAHPSFPPEEELSFEITEEELERRREHLELPPLYRRGALGKYAHLVSCSSKGAVTDFYNRHPFEED